jgi:hypothetical protein
MIEDTYGYGFIGSWLKTFTSFRISVHIYHQMQLSIECSKISTVYTHLPGYI